MDEPLRLLVSCAAGVGLGAAFFGGLWWTVRRSLTSRHAALLFLGSSITRTIALLLGFYCVAGGEWQRLLCSVFGFVTVRLAVTRIASSAMGAADAP
ncbi:MAG: ATP synthase subunit I [Planctomycetota bacterium]